MWSIYSLTSGFKSFSTTAPAAARVLPTRLRQLPLGEDNRMSIREQQSHLTDRHTPPIPYRRLDETNCAGYKQPQRQSDYKSQSKAHRQSSSHRTASHTQTSLPSRMKALTTTMSHQPERVEPVEITRTRCERPKYNAYHLSCTNTTRATFRLLISMHYRIHSPLHLPSLYRDTRRPHLHLNWHLTRDTIIRPTRSRLHRRLQVTTPWEH